jgi:hypothetical protein
VQQQFPTMMLAPEIAQAADELGIAALLDSVAEILRSFGGAESLAYSVGEWAITIRGSAIRTIRDYVQRNLMAQRVFDPSREGVCVVCSIAPCVCGIGER